MMQKTSEAKLKELFELSSDFNTHQWGPDIYLGKDFDTCEFANEDGKFCTIPHDGKRGIRLLLTSYADITPGAKHYYAYMHVSGPNLKVIESESIKVGTEANFFGNFLKPSHCVGFDISVMRLLTQKEMQEDEAFSDGNYHLGDYTARYNDLESIVDDIFTFFQQHFVQDEWVMYDSGTDIFFSDYKLPEAYKPYFVEHI